MGEVQRAINRAARHGIVLSESDFRVIDGDPCLDGMPPNEWLDAMLMD
ncbi:hypothetical protein [Mycobacteroides chelonae]|nr:hypothetical protein [Mycobacteroides chelonae]